MHGQGTICILPPHYCRNVDSVSANGRVVGMVTSHLVTLFQHIPTNLNACIVKEHIRIPPPRYCKNVDSVVLMVGWLKW